MTVRKTETAKIDAKVTDTKQEIASLKKDMDILKSDLIEVKSKLDGKYLYKEVKKYEIRNSYRGL